MDSSEAAKADEHSIAKDARNAGVPAFEFPADVTPEQKAAMAKRVRFTSPSPPIRPSIDGAAGVTREWVPTK